MKILYAIQGTGNGHLSRARDIIPHLLEYGAVDVLVSGIQADVDLGFPVTYKLKGLSFIFGKKGGVDIVATYKKGKLKQLWQEIKSLPVEEYDIVINDFEPVSAWACILRRKACIGLSHQAAVLNSRAPQPAIADLAGTALLRYYAPATRQFGFHFNKYDENIYTPVIRHQVRALVPANKGHYTLYLPAYDDKRIIKVLSQFKNIEWQVFSKHNKTKFTQGNITIQPICNEAFIQSMAAAEGVLCGAGFETPAEALYLQKKLMVIPMKGQYEQQCNAAALEKMGVPVIKSLKKKHSDKIKSWLKSKEIIQVNYPDETKEIIDAVIQQFGVIALKPAKPVHSFKKFRILLLNKLIGHLAG
jgi:uncharacterized protein (TIGR00661 family)